MNKNIIDLTGKRFGLLTVIEIAGKAPNGRIQWRCICDCGTEKIVKGHDLKSGETKSCGCYKYRKKLDSKNRIPATSKRLYKVWASMIQRCENKRCERYGDYGERGIRVCDEWRKNYYSFENWALSKGYIESAKRGQCTIDRIDNNKGYCPENCRWVTNKIQCNNRRNNRLLTLNGETHTLTEWADIKGIPGQVVRDRLFKLGWTVEKALNTPKRDCARKEVFLPH